MEDFADLDLNALVPITPAMREAALAQLGGAPAAPRNRWVSVPDATGRVVQTSWVPLYLQESMADESFARWACLNPLQEP